MSDDLWELTQYVESHPDDCEKRWSLAKRHYQAWEYRPALGHLLVLRNERPDHVNVRRYLAATYYRLSRYGEAVDELKEAIENWPKDINLREQLARALEMSGKRMEAAGIWDQVALLKPDHEFAAKAARKIREQVVGASGNAPTLIGEQFSSSAGSGSEDQIKCPTCGSKNDPDFTRCWNCHGALGPTEKSEARPEEVSHSFEAEKKYSPLPLVSGLTLVALLTGAVYLTLRQFLLVEEVNPARSIPLTLYAFLSEEFELTRILIGLALIVLWPAMLRLTVALIGVEDQEGWRLDVLGAVLAALSYLLTWTPSGIIVYTPLVVILAALILLLTVSGLSIRETLIVWPLHGLIVTVLIGTLVAANHGFGIFGDIPALYRFAQRANTAPIVQKMYAAPLSQGIEWISSGSDWLDGRAAAAGISIQYEMPEDPLILEISDEFVTRIHRDIDSTDFNIRWNGIKPGVQYQLAVRASSFTDDEGALPRINLTIQSLLEYKLLE